MEKLALILVIVISFSGCSLVKKEFRHLVSATTGLNRVITLYSYDGHIIKQWRGNFQVESEYSVISFIDADNKEVKINGTVLVEQE